MHSVQRIRINCNTKYDHHIILLRKGNTKIIILNSSLCIRSVGVEYLYKMRCEEHQTYFV